MMAFTARKTKRFIKERDERRVVFVSDYEWSKPGVWTKEEWKRQMKLAYEERVLRRKEAANASTE
jgi:hypothetical protein